MRAMPRKSPTIVQSPDNLLAARFQIIEQNLYVQIIPVNIVQMYYVGVVLFYPMNQLFRCPDGVEPLVVEQPRLQNVAIDLECRAYSDGYIPIFLGNLAPAVDDFTFVTLRQKHIGDIGTDSARTAHSADGVNH